MAIDVAPAPHKVLRGKDGWLFLNSGEHRQLDYLTAARTPSAASVGNFHANIARRADRCARAGWPYLHVVFPSKPVIMHEQLPDEVAGEVQSLFRRRYDRGDSRVFYPDALLQARGRIVPVFHKGDTHMTDGSSAIVAREILRRLGVSPPSIEDDFAFRTVPFLGDLQKLVGETTPERITVMTPYRLRATIFDNRDDLPGNTNNIAIIHTANARSDRRLLVFGDSFVRAALLFFAPAFRDILYVRSAHFDAGIAERFGPDFVLTATAERYLAAVDADDDLGATGILDALADSDDYRPDPAFTAALEATLAFVDEPARYAAWAATVEG
ncbi:alginate O-acetyltransferase AlgX-related protein [Acuticoccus mangrovi]|uniref:AlgX/AlgJ SGNH hydrolase-like domain-containing protein n=1 Tax=Acuticoccus mangrovi TaxID=2796142 RepID=A0A934IRD2_9HYPH|nr:hypothetical protein [Acuticoccus mangrovi]MBJ3777248.1 hypothetical protein [Acuticoccus mangrovi]